MLTPEKLSAAIAERQKKGGKLSSNHPGIVLDPAKPQAGLSIYDQTGKTLVVPYVRFAGAIVDGVNLEAAFGDFSVKIVRPQQPPDDDDEQDQKGAILLASVLVGLQDQLLRGLRHVPDELEVTFKVEEKKKGKGRG